MVRFILAFALQSNDFKSLNTMKVNNTELKPKASPHLAKGASSFLTSNKFIDEKELPCIYRMYT